VSEAGDPPDTRDTNDWFGGNSAPESEPEAESAPASDPESAPRAPRPVAEAFGHLPRPDEAAAGESDWFDAGAEQADGGEEPGAVGAAGADVASTPAALREVPAASPLAEPAAASAPAEAAEPAAASAPDPTPEPDGRVRLRALTGGLADLSDALAAIGVESVAVRNADGSGPARPAPAPPSEAPAVADFRVRCPDCGPQYVAVSDLRFVETGDGAEANRYLFTCPACGARVRRPAGPELAAILKSSGVATLALRRGPGQAL
jgi:ribosomal protein S27E